MSYLQNWWKKKENARTDETEGRQYRKAEMSDILTIKGTYKQKEGM